MNDDINKKTCIGCGKKDCAQCVEEDSKSFCCQFCCDKYKKEKNGQEKKEQVNVCNFC